jgi:hypothetical protein
LTRRSQASHFASKRDVMARSRSRSTASDNASPWGTVNESGIYTEADLKPYQSRLAELKQIIE